MRIITESTDQDQPPSNLAAASEPDTSPFPPGMPPMSTNRGKPLGYLAHQDKILPAEKPLTEIGKESIQYKRLLYSHAGEDEPATIAVPAQLHDNSANLVLEFIDSQSSRQWSEDELALVEQVTDQLTLALENAQLFRQTQIQAEELNLLRQVSLELAREQYDLKSVVEIIIRRATELLRLRYRCNLAVVRLRRAANLTERLLGWEFCQGSLKN